METQQIRKFTVDANGATQWSAPSNKSQSKSLAGIGGPAKAWKPVAVKLPGPGETGPIYPKGSKAVDLVKKYRRKECEDLLKRKFFYAPAFEIYGGVSGLYDFGPLGSALKANIEAKWRSHFILEEEMLELTCTCMTLSDVLKTSGHVDKFADFMVKDTKTGQCHRADKLIDDAIAKLIAKKKKPEEKEKLERIAQDCENYNAEELDKCIIENKIKAPDTGNDLSPAVPFNLMFASEIGPTGHLKGFLRPETAQGIFLNFRKLIEFNNSKMPFAGAQLGLGFRNEIHPKQGLLRVREFQMAEIEHFVDPLDKSHRKFHTVADAYLPLFTAANQEGNGDIVRDLSMGDAVSRGVVGNETLAYFMVRTFLFLTDCGIRAEGIRFRQHRSNEMAHYAQDCWDAEVETSYGWIEVAGHSDRSCFDLTRHAEKTKVDLNAARPLKEPMTLKYIQVTLDKQKIGKGLKKDSKPVCEHLENLDEEQKENYLTEMEANGQAVLKLSDKDFPIAQEFVKFERKERQVLEEKFIPSVIEPSFGIGRIIYCVFEHCFKIREKDAQRTYFDFPALVAPVKCSLLPLMNQPQFTAKVHEIKQMLNAFGVSSKIDDAGQSIGRRYARTDECGIPFALTVDQNTIDKEEITIRELDSASQVKVPVADAPQVLIALTAGSITWADCQQTYPNVEGKEAE